MTIPPGTLVLAYGRYSCLADGALTGDLARYDNNIGAFVLEQMQPPTKSGGMGSLGTRVFTQAQVQTTFATQELQLRAHQTASLDVLLRVNVVCTWAWVNTRVPRLPIPPDLDGGCICSSTKAPMLLSYRARSPVSAPSARQL